MEIAYLWDMRKFSIPSILALVLLSTTPAWALQLDIDTAVSRALQQSLDIESAELRKRAAFNTIETISLLPSVGASLSVATLSDATINASSTVSVDAGLSLRWNLTGSDLLRKSVNAVTKNQAYVDYDSSVAAVQQETISTYWRLVELHEAVKTAEAYLDFTESVHTQVFQRYEASQATELQLAQAKLSLSSAELSLQQARSNSVESTRRFLDDLGFDRSTVLELDELPKHFQLDFSRIDTLLATYISGTYVVQSANLAIESAKYSQRAVRIDATAPSVSAQVSTNLQQITNSGISTNSFPIQFSASVSIPLDRYLPRSQSATAIKQAETEVTAAQLSLASVKKSLTQQAESLATSLTHQQLNYQVLHNNLALSERTLELMTEAYHAGLSSFSELESVRKEIRDTEHTILSAQVSYVLDCYALAWLFNISYDNLVRELS